MAMMERALWPLIGFLFLYPICGLYFFLDGEILNNWRSQLFKSWEKRELDFWGFRDAMRAAPNLPKATLQSMVETLPSSSNWGMERAASEKTREVLALVVAVLHRRHAHIAFVKVTASALIAGSVILAVILGTWHPTLFIAAVVLLPLLIMWMKWLQLRKLHTLIVTARHDPKFDVEIFTGLLNHLDWSGVSLSDKEEVTATVFAPVPVSASGNNREKATL
jgi:hypothetical protein